MSAQATPFKKLSVDQINNILIQFKLRDPNTPTASAGGSKIKKIDRILKQQGGKQQLIKILEGDIADKQQKKIDKKTKTKTKTTKTKPKEFTSTPPILPKPKVFSSIVEDEPEPEKLGINDLGFDDEDKKIYELPSELAPSYIDKLGDMGEFELLIYKGIALAINPLDKLVIDYEGTQIGYYDEKTGEIENDIFDKLEELEYERTDAEAEFKEKLKYKEVIQKIIDLQITKQDYFKKEDERKLEEKRIIKEQRDRFIQEEKQRNEQTWIKFKKGAENEQVNTVGNLYEYIKERFGDVIDLEDIDLQVENVLRSIGKQHHLEDWWDTRGKPVKWDSNLEYEAGRNFDSFKFNPSLYQKGEPDRVKTFYEDIDMDSKNIIQKVAQALKTQFKVRAEMMYGGAENPNILYDSEDEEELARKPQFSKFAPVKSYAELGSRIGLSFTDVVDTLEKKKPDFEYIEEKFGDEDTDEDTDEEVSEDLDLLFTLNEKDREIRIKELLLGLETGKDKDLSYPFTEFFSITEDVYKRDPEFQWMNWSGTGENRDVFEYKSISDYEAIALDEQQLDFLKNKREKEALGKLNYDDKYNKAIGQARSGFGNIGFSGADYYIELLVLKEIGLPPQDLDKSKYFENIRDRKRLEFIKSKSVGGIQRLIEKAGEYEEEDTDEEEESEEELDFNDPKWDEPISSSDEDTDEEDDIPTQVLKESLFENQDELDIDLPSERQEDESQYQYDQRLKKWSERIGVAVEILDKIEEREEKEEQEKQLKIEEEREKKAERFLKIKERQLKKEEEERKRQQREREILNSVKKGKKSIEVKSDKQPEFQFTGIAQIQEAERQRQKYIAEKKEWERSLALKTPLPISPRKKRFMIVNYKLEPGIPGDKGFPQPPVKTFERREIITVDGRKYYKDFYEKKKKENPMFFIDPSDYTEEQKLKTKKMAEEFGFFDTI